MACVLERHLDAGKDGQRLRDSHGPGIARAAVGGIVVEQRLIDQRAGGSSIIIGAERRIFAVEKVVDQTENFDVIGNLVRRMGVDDVVEGKLRVLVGIVAYKILTSDENCIRADLKARIDFIFRANFPEMTPGET